MVVTIMNKKQRAFLGKLKITGKIFVETGLHIGGGEENLDIGGVDKLVIRDPITRYPYIPGSSLKGKLRAILERILNKPVNRFGGSETWRYESDDLVDGYSEIERNENHLNVVRFTGARECEISRLFGSTGNIFWVEQSIAEDEKLDIIDENEKQEIETGKQFVKVKGRNYPARLIVRDCHLIDDSIKPLKNIDTGLYMTEWKFENSLDRVTSAANPRQVERLPKGSILDFELVYTVENSDHLRKDLQNIAIALAILEDDALGGHGSRGYGKIRFQGFQFYYRDLEQYKKGLGNAQSNQTPIDTQENTDQLLENVNRIVDKINKVLPSGEEE